MFIVRSGAAVAAGVLVALATICGPAVGQPQLSTQDQQFLLKAHQGNLAEIAAGRLAQSKSPSQQVRDIGAMLVTDHTRLDAAGGQVAAMVGMKLPQTPNADQQAMQAKLENASPADFDRMFITTQLAGHAEVLKLAMAEQQTGTNPSVRQAAASAAPVVQKHIDALSAAARDLNVPISINTGSAGLAATPSQGWRAVMLVVAGLMLAGIGVLGLRRRATR
jgi:putative membrane protein